MLLTKLTLTNLTWKIDSLAPIKGNRTQLSQLYLGPNRFKGSIPPSLATAKISNTLESQRLD